MRRFPLIAGILLAALWTMPAFAQAAGGEDDGPDCGKIRGAKKAEAYKENVRDVEKCILRGWDPPVDWRPDKGLGIAAKVSGGGGFNVTNVQAPDQPPAVRNIPASVNQLDIDFSASFPPWAGFPCQVPGGPNLCDDGDDEDGDGEGGDGTGGTGDTVTTCPINDDTNGTFGQKMAISGSTSYSLACGGSLPLSTYQITLSQNPVGLAATEYNSYYLWTYKADHGTDGKALYKQTTGSPIALPQHLCKKVDGKMKKSVDLKPPIAQLILYSASANALAIRLIPATDLPDPMYPDPQAEPEKYLVVPLKNGVPQMPGNCANETDYYKPLNNIGGDLTFETSNEPGCEDYGNGCSQMGLPTTSTTPPNCEAVIVYPQGTTTTPQGTVDCSATQQLMVVDRPNLLYPPGSSASTIAIDGRTSVLAATVANSKIYTSSESIIRLNHTIHSFTLPEGGMMALNNGARLIMSGPATINTNTGTVKLDNGGEIRDTGGTTIATYKSGVTITPPTNWPLTIRLNRNIEMPAGYYVPTQPAPYILGPVSPP